MASKQTPQSNSSTPRKSKITRPGVHAKTKFSSTKHNKNYNKAYQGQGK
jgi:hypothetical protein